ncbi:hypothetical protein FHS37_007688 [Streptomyces griseostramineus]|uniref:Uncharacterized protein n=1 Tax=Streptomyces griseomycini TaxID=66895 RepID=A0A7W7PYD0_9ACTN|nr:hypothetical protein [Streptomyces griseomycini]
MGLDAPPVQRLPLFHARSRPAACRHKSLAARCGPRPAGVRTVQRRLDCDRLTVRVLPLPLRCRPAGRAPPTAAAAPPFHPLVEQPVADGVRTQLRGPGLLRHSLLPGRSPGTHVEGRMLDHGAGSCLTLTSPAGSLQEDSQMPIPLPAVTRRRQSTGHRGPRPTRRLPTGLLETETTTIAPFFNGFACKPDVPWAVMEPWSRAWSVTPPVVTDQALYGRCRKAGRRSVVPRPGFPRTPAPRTGIPGTHVPAGGEGTAADPGRALPAGLTRGQ